MGDDLAHVVLGLLTITAPLRFGHLHVSPVLDAILCANPWMRARLLLLDRVANLVEEGIDVAVRLTHLSDSTMVATRVGEVRRIPCASPTYIERCRPPKTAAGVREHTCIMERDKAETGFASVPGKPLLPISIQSRLVVNSAAVAVDPAVAGHRITRVMSYQAAAAVSTGKLVVLLAQHEPPPIPVHVLLPSARSTTMKQRAFVAFAAPRLRCHLDRAANQIGRVNSGRR
jgi:DNA-binding transcriptional LysR family regulator